MFENYKYYLRDRYDFDGLSWFCTGLAVWVIGGVLGFIYEIIFYWANSGFHTFYWRGGTFGPWIDAYAIASLFIYLILYRLRRQPWFVVLISAAMCGAVQLLIGLGLYYLCDGARAWNYNLEILNAGNLAGFICIRTFVEFAVLGLLVIYVIVPLVFHMACTVRRNTFVAIWLIIGLICLADMIYNDVACALLPSLTGAADLYPLLGLRYLSY